jgi:hypothetical protein
MILHILFEVTEKHRKVKQVCSKKLLAVFGVCEMVHISVCKGKTAVIILKILGATVQSVITWMCTMTDTVFVFMVKLCFYTQGEGKLHGQIYRIRIYITIQEKKCCLNTGLLKHGFQVTAS